MDRIKLGITGLEVTPLALGTWQLGGDWGDFDQREWRWPRSGGRVSWA
jgi:aryl-alcohol dehydrogenase-like predicted oxidoreductase